ncbi:MAG: hypothetical protein J6T91_00240 [Alphaproteobacteria bacterium]|nr:hypothetical protein [Alphaproteobacteria bacterium]
MKRVIFTTVAFCLIDAILATTCYIDVRKESGTDVVKVRHNKITTELSADEPIVLDGIGVGLWDGTSFFMTEGSLSDGGVEISSGDMPVIFDSFLSSQCKVYSPGLEVWGNTQVNELIAEFKRPKQDILDVVGKLVTRNLHLWGSSEINGEIFIQKDGSLNFRRPGVFSLTVNGKLESEDDFKISTRTISKVNVVNNGEISSGTKTISCSVASFINGENGRIEAEEGNFQMGFGGRFQNFGKLTFDRFFVQGRRLLNFLQKGTLSVQDQAFFDCSLESSGETYIHHLVFSRNSDLKVLGERAVVNKIGGEIAIAESKGGAKAEIGNIEDGAEFISSEGRRSRLTVKKLNSRKRTVFSAQAGSSTTIKDANTPENFMYSDDAKLKVGNLKGKSTASIAGTSEFEANHVENLSLVAKKGAQTRISDSNSKEAFLLGGKHFFRKGKAAYINNRAELELKDMEVEKIENNNKIVFKGKTSVEKFSDRGESTYADGEHQLKEYISADSKLNVKGKEKATETDDNKNTDAPITLKDKGVVVSVDKLKGTGTIDAEYHSYKQVIPTAFVVKGNVGISVDNMPDPCRMPFHGDGNLQLNVDMSEDYTNQTDRDYKDVYITMRMHGHNWRNRRADFLSGKLKVEEAFIFSNVDGHVDIDKDLDVDGKFILNTSTPKKELRQISRRHVQREGEITWACYDDVFVDHYSIGDGFIRSRNGAVSLKGEDGVRNEYSRIISGKKFNLESKNGKVSNYLGDIISVGKEDSKIDAKQFENTCIPQTAVQVGMRDHWFLWLKWSTPIYSSYNPSGNSNIYSVGNLFLKSAQAPIVRGSDISSEKSIYLEFPETSMNVINELDNSSQIRAGEKIYLNGRDLNIRSSVFSAMQDIAVKTPDGQISITNDDRRTIKRPAIDIDVKKEMQSLRGILDWGSFESKSPMIDIPKEILPSITSFLGGAQFDPSKKMVISSNYPKLLPIIFSKYGILKSEFEGNTILKLLSGESTENTTALVKSDNDGQLRFSFSLNNWNLDETELELDRLHIPEREVFTGLRSVKGKVDAEASKMNVEDSAVVGASVKINVKEKGQGTGRFSATGAVIMATEDNVNLHADNGSSIHSRRDVISHYHRNGNKEVYWEELKATPSMIGAKNGITISGGDTDIGGTKFKSRVFNDETTNMRIGADKTRLHFWGKDKKEGLFSSKTIHREGYMDVGTFSEIDCETVNSSGGHGITFESVNANGVKRFICSKPVFNETAATLEYHDKTTVKSRGISFGKMSISDPLADACMAAAQANNAKAQAWSAISAVAKAKETIDDAMLIGTALTSPAVSNPLSMAAGVAGKRFVNASITIGNKTEVTEKNQTQQVPTMMMNAERIKLDCSDSVHLQGLHQTKKLEINTPKLTSEGIVNTCDVESKVTGWSYSINPVTALLTYAIPGVGAVVGQTLTAGQAIACASSVSVMHQSQNIHQKTHAPTMMIAEDYDINVGQAHLKDTQIRGKRGKVHVKDDLKIESSRDEYSNDVEGRSYSSSLGFMAAKNGAQAAVSLVTGTSRGVTDIHEKNNRVNNFSALTAEDSFELEVGGNLEATSAYYGQKKLDEPITAPRAHLDSNNPKEQVKIKGKAHHNILDDEYSYKDGSYNVSIGDLYQVAGAIEQTVFDNAIEEGATTEEAKSTVEETNKAAEIVAETEIKVQSKRKERLQKIKTKVAKESSEIAEQTSKMSDGEFALFMVNYTESHDDNLAQEFVRECIIANMEEQEAYQEAARRLEKMSFGEKAQEYVGYFVDELTKPSPEMVEAFTCGDPSKMREKIRESVDKTTLNVTSGLLDLLTPFDVSAANEQLHGEISSEDNAIRQAVAVGETAAIGYGLSKFTKAKIVVKFYQKVRSVKNGVINRVAGRFKGSPNVSVEMLEKNNVKSGAESWQVRKAKIKGKAQVTKTPGHEIGSMRIAVEESKKSDVEVIYMDKSLKDVTNGEINSRKRPDVTVVRKDGRIITHEVKSKSQTKTELRDKIDKMQKSLPENRRDLEGVSDVFDVEGRKI